MASQTGFHLLATSDHLQPWQANEGHAGEAWVTLAALGGHATQSRMGTTVTCPTMRYNPAVVAEAFASLSDLYPGSLGIAPTGNIDPEKRSPSMFEPIHGSAFDITGKGVTNPIRSFWTAPMMLAHLGEQRAADLLMGAI
jgi:hypothetical protein